MRIVLLFWCSTLLVACGGGGSDTGSSNTVPPIIVDSIAPSAPVQRVIDNEDGTIQVWGTAEAGSRVDITFPDGKSQVLTASQSGDYGPINSDTPQPNGMVSATATDSAGNRSSITKTNYTDTIAPLRPIPNIAVNDNKTISVSGKSEAQSLITVIYEDGSTATNITLADGTFSPITSAEAQFSGDIVVTATDAAGNVSSEAKLAYEIPAAHALWELAQDEQAKDIVRFLTQATFGPTERDIQNLVARGAKYEAWINAQIAIQPSSLLTKYEQRLQDAGFPVTSRENLDFSYPKQLAASDMLWDLFAYGDDQLRQRVAFALSQIFVVSETSDTLFNNARGIVAYHDLLANNALGNYRELIEAVTLNPIMGEYLSMIRNEKANSEENIRPDENYARELMQLFSIGLVMLNQDGSIQIDENGQPIPTYNQDTIKAFARVFTGWTYKNATSWDFDGWLFGDTINPMIAFENFHDTDEKILLNGEIVPAGQSASQNLKSALDNLFNHSNVPPFIGKQLIQRLVTSNPSPEYVSRISAVFRDNGSGVRGDLGAVVKAILLDTEARTGQRDRPSTFGKLKEPILKFTALIRAFDVTGLHPINEEGLQRQTLRFFYPAAASGQRPYAAPSVFNFFRPDHSPAGPIRDSDLVAPELQILNESFITNATNYGSAPIFNSYDFLLNDCQPRLNFLDGFGCPYPDFSDELALTNDISQLLSRLSLLMLAGDMSDITKDALSVLAQQQTEPRFVVAEVVHLIYLSPEFAVQR
ncbi:DUF1800 family protein [Paraglaciecola sp. 25GB23A]|uniref:DUF1800 family protein n=1 Tax=Paraglaciecola sp. 25GB23A TaxID=3156068 RepID=UPI0032AE977C